MAHIGSPAMFALAPVLVISGHAHHNCETSRLTPRGHSPLAARAGRHLLRPEVSACMISIHFSGWNTSTATKTTGSLPSLMCQWIVSFVADEVSPARTIFLLPSAE